MKNKIYLALLLTALSLTANADTWTGALDINALSTSRVDLTTSVSISGTCVNNSKAYLSPSAENHQEVVSLILAAMMTEKQIDLYCSDTCSSTNRCNVVDVRILK